MAVAAGGRHALALTDAGRLYGWGWNESRQLGHRPPITIHNPMLLSWAQRMTVQACACGLVQSVALDDRERLWATGRAGGRRAERADRKRPGSGEEAGSAGPHAVDLAQALTLAEALGGH